MLGGCYKVLYERLFKLGPSDGSVLENIILQKNHRPFDFVAAKSRNPQLN